MFLSLFFLSGVFLNCIAFLPVQTRRLSFACAVYLNDGVEPDVCYNQEVSQNKGENWIKIVPSWWIASNSGFLVSVRIRIVPSKRNVASNFLFYFSKGNVTSDLCKKAIFFKSHTRGTWAERKNCGSFKWTKQCARQVCQAELHPCEVRSVHLHQCYLTWRNILLFILTVLSNFLQICRGWLPCVHMYIHQLGPKAIWYFYLLCWFVGNRKFLYFASEDWLTNNVT